MFNYGKPSAHLPKYKSGSLQVYDEVNRSYVNKDKIWGKSIQTTEFYGGLRLFFNTHHGKNIRVLKEFRHKILSLKTYIFIDSPLLTGIFRNFENQNELRFYSSSILLTYEGDSSAEPNLQLKMIDFSSVWPIRDAGIDEGYIRGIKTLLHFFDQLIEDAEKMQIETQTIPL